MWLLAFGLLLQQPGSSDDPRRVVAQVMARVERGDTFALYNGIASSDRLAILARATQARLTYRYEEAEERYTGLAAANAGPLDRIGLYARLGLADQRLVTFPYDSAVAAYEQAALLARTLADTAAWVEALLGAAFARSRWDRPGAADAELVLAGRLAPHDSLALRSAVECSLAGALVQRLSPAALLAAKEGLTLARAARDRRLEAICLRVLGSHYGYAGEIPSALAALDTAATLQRDLHDRVELANTLRWIGWLQLNWYDYPAADRTLARALVESQASGLQASVGWTLRHQAAIAWRFGDLSGALTLLDSAEAVLGRQRDGWGVVSTRGLRGDVALDAGRPKEAEAGFRAQVGFGQWADRPIETYTGLLGLLHLRMREHNWDSAARQLEVLRRFVRTHGQPGWNARLEYEAGEVALNRHDVDTARRHFTSYLRSLDLSDYLAVYAARSRLAQTALAGGDIGRVIVELTAASDALDRFRVALDDDKLRLLAFQSRQAYDDDAGFATVIAGLAAAGRTELALEFAERRRARVLSDQLREAGLRSNTSTTSSSRLRAALPDSAALLFLQGGRRGQPSTLFLAQRSGTSAFLAPGMEIVETLSREFTTLLQGGVLALEQGNRLREALLEPVLPHLDPGVALLVIVPDGELYRLPFDALPLDNGDRVVSRFAVAIAPSATVAVDLWERPRTEAPLRALALGDALSPSLEGDDASDAGALYKATFRQAGGLPRIRASAAEAKVVAQFVPGADVRLHAAASEAWLKQARLEGFRLIHFALHAAVSEQSITRTALALAPGGGEDGFVGAEEIARLRLDADLVVLSACRTAGGVIVGGEGIQGLSSALLKAGARAVLATSWQVGDKAAARFTERFYHALAAGETAAQSLRSARLASIAARAPPDEWAAFVLVGDSEVRLPLRSPRRGALPLIAALALLVLAAYGVTRRRRGRDSTVRPS